MSRPSALLIRHLGDSRGDRAARLLAERGFELDWRWPAGGERLPEPLDSDHRIAVVYGGIQSANDVESDPAIAAELRWIERWLATGRPFLGLCLGAQLLARCLGARVARRADQRHEIGFVEIQPTASGTRFFPGPIKVYAWHNEGFDLPGGTELLASSATFPNQAFRYGDRTFGLQFHPEVTPAIMRTWMEEAGHMLAAPGAHSRDRQLRDARRYDAAMGRWFEGFLDQHLLAECLG